MQRNCCSVSLFHVLDSILQGLNPDLDRSARPDQIRLSAASKLDCVIRIASNESNFDTRTKSAAVEVFEQSAIPFEHALNSCFGSWFQLAKKRESSRSTLQRSVSPDIVSMR